MLELKPDLEAVLDRYEAWWNCEVLDRPPVSLTFAKPAAEKLPLPQKQHASLRDRWLDIEFQIECASASLSNTVHYADALPIAWPNLGPDVFAAYYGCPLVFGETTSWSMPILPDWGPSSLARLKLDTRGFYFRKTLEMTDAFLDAARGRFLIAFTDLHPGGDAVAAFRDPQELAIDLIERPDEVRALCHHVTDDFLPLYDVLYKRLAASQPVAATWMGCASLGKQHIPSNDFSCMISERMFQDLFLPAIVRECRHMRRSIYHLDGPGALRHLDALLAVPEIQAIQWVAGEGHEDWKLWIDVYRRIQRARKALVLVLPANELSLLFETLRPEGVWLIVQEFGNTPQEADSVLAAVSRWR
ncbi:MAG: trimethylamine corrinoid protein 2 [Planctomycetota bacterium]